MNRPARFRRLFWALLKAAFGLALFLWLWRSGRLDLGHFAAARSAPGLVAAALAVTALVPCLAALRWSLLVRAQGLALSPLRALRLQLIAFFFNIFLPGATAGGDLARAYYIARDEKRRTAAVTTVAFDRVLGLACMLGLATVGLLLHLNEVRASPELAWLLLVAGGGALGAAGLAGFFFSRRLHGWRERLCERVSPGSTDAPLEAAGTPGTPAPAVAGWRRRLGGIFHRADEALHLYRKRPGVIAGAILLSLLMHLSAVAAIYFYGLAFGVAGFPFGRYVFLVPLALTANAVPLAPMGLGQGEGVCDALFERFGPATKGAGGTLFLAWRLGLFLLGLAGGVLYVLERSRAGERAAATPSTPKE